LIKVYNRGSFKNLEAFGQRVRQRTYLGPTLSKYGAIGVTALSGATPVESGLTGTSWYYQIVDKPGYFAIHWLNSHMEEPGSINIAVILQYGHATRGGGYVQGRDYINPAIQPIFDQMVTDMWREVTK
jgi:hypothetical protein